MKQLYFTSCRTNHSLNGGSGGFKTRAASEGLSFELRADMESVASYQLPDRCMEVAGAPVRLAFFHKDGRLFLCRSEYIGADPETGRKGNFFSHVISGDGLTCRQAIESWNSSSWVSRDGDFPPTLPEIDLPVGCTLTVEEVVAGIQEESARKLFKWMICAWLEQADAAGRIVVAAQPELLARIIYGLISVLPKQLTEALTFSTYEYAPLLASSRVTGAILQDNRDLPLSCYQGGTVGYNTINGKASEVRDRPISLLIDQCFEAGDVTPIVEFIREIESSGSAMDVALFDTLCEIKLNREIGYEQFFQLLNCSPPFSDMALEAANASQHLAACCSALALNKINFDALPESRIEAILAHLLAEAHHAIQKDDGKRIDYCLRTAPTLHPLLSRDRFIDEVAQHKEMIPVNVRKRIISALLESGAPEVDIKVWLTSAPDNQVTELIESTDIQPALNERQRVRILAPPRPVQTVAPILNRVPDLYHPLLDEIFSLHTSDQKESDEQLYRWIGSAHRCGLEERILARLPVAQEKKLAVLHILSRLSFNPRHVPNLMRQISESEQSPDSTFNATLLYLVTGFTLHASDEDRKDLGFQFEKYVALLESRGVELPPFLASRRQWLRILESLTLDSQGIRSVKDFIRLVERDIPAEVLTRDLAQATMKAYVRSANPSSFEKFVQILERELPVIFPKKSVKDQLLSSFRKKLLPLFYKEFLGSDGLESGFRDDTSAHLDVLLHHILSVMKERRVKVDPDVIKFIRRLHSRLGKSAISQMAERISARAPELKPIFQKNWRAAKSNAATRLLKKIITVNKLDN